VQPAHVKPNHPVVAPVRHVDATIGIQFETVAVVHLAVAAIISLSAFQFRAAFCTKLYFREPHLFIEACFTAFIAEARISYI
jgi:hypothetical protein